MNLKFLSLTELEKIWALLPHDYDDSEERYPVMYLQDAQNLFNEDAEYGNGKLTKAGGNVGV
jgi:predicted alpha/beta superfamily hydrolase